MKGKTSAREGRSVSGETAKMYQSEQATGECRHISGSSGVGTATLKRWSTGMMWVYVVMGLDLLIECTIKNITIAPIS